MSLPARPSLGWDTVGERYGHFYVENFRQLTALPKYTSISIKKVASVFLDVCTKKRHTVWNNSYLQYRKRRLLKQRLLVYLHRCASRCERVWLWRHVCSLRGSSWWLWPLFEICILLLQWIIDTRIYVHGTKNNILRLNFHNAFRNVFLIILLLDYKEFEFAWCVFEK